MYIDVGYLPPWGYSVHLSQNRNLHITQYIKPAGHSAEPIETWQSGIVIICI